MTDEKIRLILELAGVATVDEAVKKLNKLKETTEDTGKSAANMGRTFLESGRILQDFAQGGIPGIINNLEGLSRALGGGPGLAGIVTIAGVAALIATPLIKSFFSSLGDGGDTMKPLKDRIDDNAKAIDGYREKLKHTTDEVTRYNEAIAQQAKLEKEAKERKLEAKAHETTEATPTAQQKERGEILDFNLRGHEEAALGEIRSGLEAYNQPKVAEIKARAASREEAIRQQEGIQPPAVIASMRRNAAAKYAKEMGSFQAATQRTAERLFGSARGGDAKAIGQIQSLLGPDSEFGDAFANASVEAQRDRRLADVDADQQRQRNEAKQKEDAELRDLDGKARAGALHHQQLGSGKAEFERREQERKDNDEYKAMVEKDYDAAIPKVGTGARLRAQKAREHKEQAEAATQASAQADVTAMAQNLGFGTPSADQAKRMADDTISGLRDGLSRQHAAFAAVMAQVERINAAQQEFTQRMQQMGTSARFGPAQQSFTNQTWGMPY